MHGRAQYHLALHVEGDIGLEATLAALFGPELRTAVRAGVFGDVVLDLPPCLDSDRVAQLTDDAFETVRAKAQDYLQHTHDWFDLASEVDVLERSVTLLEDAWRGHPPGSLVLRVRTALGELHHVRNDVIVSIHTGHVFHLMPPRDARPERVTAGARSRSRSRPAFAAHIAQEAHRQLQIATTLSGRQRRRRRDPSPDTRCSEAPSPALPCMQALLTSAPDMQWALDISAHVRELSSLIARATSDASTHRTALVELLVHACERLQERLHAERYGLSVRLARIGPVQRLSYAIAHPNPSRIDERTIGYGFRDDHAYPAGWARQRLSRSTRMREGARTEALAEHTHYIAQVRLQHLTALYAGDDVPLSTAMGDLLQLLKAWQQLLDALLCHPGSVEHARRAGVYATFPLLRDGATLRPRIEDGAMMSTWRSFIAPGSAEVAAGVAHELSPVIRGIGGGSDGRVLFSLSASPHRRNLLRLRCIGYEDLQFLRVRLLARGCVHAERVVAIPATRHLAAVNGRRRPWLSDIVCLVMQRENDTDELLIEGLDGGPAVDIVSVEWIALPDTVDQAGA